jgi:hypothetical protein
VGSDGFNKGKWVRTVCIDLDTGVHAVADVSEVTYSHSYRDGDGADKGGENEDEEKKS